MGFENLAYALTQWVHNFGAVAVVGGALFALWPDTHLERARTFARLILVGWVLQIASGVGFGLTSLYYYGETPDLSTIATFALAVKVVSALAGAALAAAYLARSAGWSADAHVRTFQSLTALGAIALTAAAFLRWFS